MKLLIIRHGAAMDRDEFAETGESDDQRPLTDDGRREMKKVAKGLRKELKEIDVLATSPYVRAVQTAEIVADEYEMDITETTTVLVPEAGVDDFDRWIRGFGERRTVAIVGHEPHLSCLATWLMSGKDDSRIRLKKAGACLLEFVGYARRDAATLNWLLTPRQAENIG